MTRLDPEDTEIYQPERSLREYWRWSRVHDPLWHRVVFWSTAAAGRPWVRRRSLARLGDCHGQIDRRTSQQAAEICIRRPCRSYPVEDRSHAADAKGRAKQQLEKGNLTRGQYEHIVSRANEALREHGGKSEI
jgi:heme oxygenase